MNIVSGYSPMYRVAQNSVKKAPVSFGHIYDYYDPDEIKEASEHHGVFRNPGEDSWEYEKRAREINEAWKEVQEQHETKKHWWEF